MSKGKYKRKREHAQQKAEQQEAEIRFPDGKVIPTERQTEHASAGQEKRERKQESEMGFREAVKRSSVTDWCIMLFTGVLTVVGYYQLNAMSGQLNVMREDQRPWVGLKEIGPVPTVTANVPFAVWIALGNFGKSPAFLKQHAAELRLIKGEFPDTIAFTTPRPPGYDKEREPLFPGDTGIKQLVKYTLSEDDVRDISSNTQRLYLFGEIQYINSTDSNAVHTTRFCWSFASTGTTVVNGKTVQTVVGVGCHGQYPYAD